MFFLGDEPHLNIEAYVAAFLELAETIGARRILGFGGVYGELPYDKERMISSSYSLKKLGDAITGTNLLDNASWLSRGCQPLASTRTRPVPTSSCQISASLYRQTHSRAIVACWRSTSSRRR